MLDERVDQLALLDVNVLVGSPVVVGQLTLNLVDGQFLRFDLALLEDADGEFLRNVNNGGGTIVAAASALGLQLDEELEQVLALSRAEINLSIRVHSEGKWRLRRQFILNVLEIFVVVLRDRALEACAALGVGEELSLIE